MPSITIIRSEYDEAYEHFTPLEGGIEVTSHPYLVTIRVLAKDPLLSLVGCDGAPHLYLASWLFPPSSAQVPLFQKLLVIRDIHSPWPRDLPPPSELRVRLLPHAAFQDLRRETRRRADSDARSLKLDTREARTSAVRRLARMGLDREAHDLSSGAVPFSLPLPSARENWASLIRNRSAT